MMLLSRSYIFEAQTNNPREVRVVNGETYQVIPHTDTRYNGPFDKGYTGRGGSGHFIIDFDRSPTIQKTLVAVKKRVPFPDASELDILNRIRDEVKQLIGPAQYTEVNTFAQAEQLRQGETVLSLEDYVRSGKMTCVHGAITAALVIEKLRDEGRLKGVPFIQSRAIGDSSLAVDAHLHAGYKSDASGDEYVLDAPYDFVGKEEEYKLVLKRVLADILWATN